MNGVIGEVRLFGGNFAPRTWAFCAGQLISISTNTALFSIIGCTYGGDCRTTMALPDLRGRAAMSPGAGPGLPDYNLGQKTGQETVTLTVSSMPAHNHAINVNAANGGVNTPQNSFWAAGETSGNPPNLIPINTIYSTTADTQMNAFVMSNSGGNLPHNNMQPSTALNYIICMQGIFPSRG